MKFIVLGAGGMAGHLITRFLMEKKQDVLAVARRKLSFCDTTILDVTDDDGLRLLLKSYNCDVVINCIGILNDEAESHSDKAVYLNSYLPHRLKAITESMRCKVVQISTDCIFSGDKGGYTEKSMPDAKTIYGRSKALGEITDKKNLTIRTSIIGPDINNNGIGLLNWYIKQKGEVNGFDKMIWTGVTTNVLAEAILKGCEENISGLYHLVNNETISKYSLLVLFSKYINQHVRINKIDGKISNKSLVNNRNDFKFDVCSYEIQVKEMFDWIKAHPDLYPSYIEKMVF